MNMNKAKLLTLISLMGIFVFPYSNFGAETELVRIGVKEENIKSIFSELSKIIDEFNKDKNDFKIDIKPIGKRERNIFETIPGEFDVVITTRLDYEEITSELSDKLVFYQKGSSHYFLVISSLNNPLSRDQSFCNEDLAFCF